MLKKMLLRAIVSITLALCILIPTSPPASALGPKSESFSLSWSSVMDINTCLYFTLSGTVSYTTVKQSVYFYGKVYTQFVISAPTINKPKLVVTVKSYSSFSGCYGSAYLTELDYTQHWAGYSCSLNPSISVGYPFSVGVSFWPSCSNRNQAKYRTDPKATASSYTQYNSSSYVRYSNVSDLDTPPSAPCYGAFVNAIAYSGGNSDSYSSAAKQVCLHPTW